MARSPATDIGPLFSGADAPAEEDLYKCVHCGFCLQACPTYLETGLETESPRGRIALMKAVNEGRIGITENVLQHWDLCIQCRACEVACPSGVPYGSLIEATMAQAADHRKPSLMARTAERLLVGQILPNQRRLSLLVGGLRLYKNIGLQSAVRKTGLLQLLSPRLAELESSSPTVPSTKFAAKGQVVPAVGTRRARVAILSGCIMSLVHGPEMNAVTRVLARNGCDVEVTRGQVCCGAIHTHVGDLERARTMARRNIDVFLGSDLDAVVVASAGCGARMKEYDHLLQDDSDYAHKAKDFVQRVRDVNEFLYDLPVIPPEGRLDRRVTYQDSCHLSNAQRVTEAPRALLAAIPGLELIELGNANQCCGAGGTYTITQRNSSLRLLDKKMAAVQNTGADVVATANPGCVIQLQHGVKRAGATAEVRYVTDLLEEAYQSEN